ncbi:unnamed protein product [Rotaria magnacalcarata]
MPSIKSDPYAAQISSNIFKLTNVAPIPFEIQPIFGLFNQAALLRFFEQHQALGVDIAPFVFGMLVHAAMMLDGVELFNPDGTGFITSMNLFIHLIGEPGAFGTNKSGLFRVFNNSINALQKIFPSFFSKPVLEVIKEKEKLTTINLIVNNETELSLFQRLSKRENVFISSDELDVINTRFGVYMAGYDIMKNVSRTTGSSSFFIERGSINIFGASTGNMLSSVCRQYNSDIMSDVIVPPDIEEARKNILNPIPTTEPISNLKPSVVVDIKEDDMEQDGSIISAYNAIRRVIEAEHEKSLQRDVKRKPIYTPLQRAFQRKSSNKLARLAGLCQAMSYAIRLCSECINTVRFGDGLYLKEYIDDEQINWLVKFHDNAKVLIERDIAMAPKYGSDQRPLFVIEKSAVHASNMLYQYNSSTISTLFDGTATNNNETTKNENNISINNELLNDIFYEHQSILLKMTSPILLKAWFNNEITGLPFTKIFIHYRKAKSKMPKLINAIDELVRYGILQKGVKDNRYVVIARKETYLKTSPATIRRNTRMLNYLQSIGVDIDTYEHTYLSSPLPMNMELTVSAVNLITSDDDYLQYCHLFNDVRIQKEMEERLSKHMIEYRMSFGRKQYYMPPLSQIVEEANFNIENSQQYDGDQTPTNNNDDNDGNSGDNHNDNNDNLLSSLLFIPHRLINNQSPNTISSRSEKSSLLSEILNTNYTTELQSNNFTDQTTESDNQLRNNFLAPVDDNMEQLTNTLDYDPPNFEQSGKSTL